MTKRPITIKIPVEKKLPGIKLMWWLTLVPITGENAPGTIANAGDPLRTERLTDLTCPFITSVDQIKEHSLPGSPSDKMFKNSANPKKTNAM